MAKKKMPGLDEKEQALKYCKLMAEAHAQLKAVKTREARLLSGEADLLSRLEQV
jgi:hypothetical protein